MTRFLLVLLLVDSFVAGALASENDVAAEKAARAVAISAPRPEYPYEARRARITGKGIAVMHVDTSTGVVSDAVMAQSTGHAILDNAALGAFRRWRFKPGTVAMVKLPITFAMAVTVYPSRWYPFSGIVRGVDVRASTITVKGPTGTDTIVVSLQTQLRKNSQRITLGDIAISDTVSGRATVRPPKFTAVAQSITVKASSR
jgi:TonB family protein